MVHVVVGIEAVVVAEIEAVAVAMSTVADAAVVVTEEEEEVATPTAVVIVVGEEEAASIGVEAVEDSAEGDVVEEGLRAFTSKFAFSTRPRKPAPDSALVTQPCYLLWFSFHSSLCKQESNHVLGRVSQLLHQMPRSPDSKMRSSKTRLMHLVHSPWRMVYLAAQPMELKAKGLYSAQITSPSP